MHSTYELWRIMIPVLLFACGAINIAFPRYFLGMEPMLQRVRRECSLPQAARLEHVMDAGYRPEASVTQLTVAIGIFGISMGAAALVRWIPPLIPYGLYCMALAFGLLVAYERRAVAGRPRMASIAPRSPFASFSPWLVASALLSLATSLPLARVPGLALGGSFVAIAVIVLIVVAWRVATRPDVVLGIDPRLESAVEARFRVCSVAQLVVLASMLSYLAGGYAHAEAGSSVWYVLQFGGNVAFLIAILVLAVVQRKIQPVVTALNEAA